MFGVSESRETQSQWMVDMETKCKKDVPDRKIDNVDVGSNKNVFWLGLESVKYRIRVLAFHPRFHP